MKIHFTTKTIVFLCLILVSTSLIGQTYTPPSRELVLSFLERINNCKEAQNKFQESLANMEANPDDYTLREYNNVKRLIESAQTCLNSLRGQLDKLREQYPGWFNDPNAVFDIDRNHSIKPRDLDDMLDDIRKKINRALARFEQLSVPEH